MALNLKNYAGQQFIKPDDVRNHPLRRKIAGIIEGKFKKPDLTFENGDVLSLNGTNVNKLRDVYGDDSESLVGKVIELYLGQLKYNGTYHDAVLVKPLSPPDGQPISVLRPPDVSPPPVDGSPPVDDSPPPPRGESDYDDEIPF